MSIDFETEQFTRQYGREEGPFRALSFLTKSVAAYLRNLVDPKHGWLELCGDNITKTALSHAAGEAIRTESRVISRCITSLLDEGYVVRCRLVAIDLGTFATHDDREVPISSWAEDQKGGWLVIRNWVAAQSSLNPDDTRAWHQARCERISAALENAASRESA